MSQHGPVASRIQTFDRRGGFPLTLGMRLVNVDLADRSYKIRIGEGMLPKLGAECGQLGLGQRCAIVTDANIPANFLKTAQGSLKQAGFEVTVFKLPGGEQSKRLKHVEQCYDHLAAHRMERKSFIVALGGGVVGDLAGFVAASYLRGIEFVQVPTTLLSQVDSSVGGKTGVNLKAGKNLVGAFHQPKLVLCDLDTLKTLPERELRAGMAEVIKYGIISDPKLFRRLEKEMDQLLAVEPKSMAAVVARSCQIKADVVGQDEKEGGLRAILNFGHTIGHAIEAISGYGKFLHGEAISIGQVAAAMLSRDLLGMSQAEVDRIAALFEQAGLPTTIKFTKAQRAKLLAAMQLDKKVQAGEIKFVLAEKIGSVKFGLKVPESAVHAVLDEVVG